MCVRVLPDDPLHADLQMSERRTLDHRLDAVDASQHTGGERGLRIALRRYHAVAQNDDVICPAGGEIEIVQDDKKLT